MRFVLAWVVPPVAPGRTSPLSRRWKRGQGNGYSPGLSLSLTFPSSVPAMAIAGTLACGCRLMGRRQLGIPVSASAPCSSAPRRHPWRRACSMAGWQTDRRLPWYGCRRGDGALWDGYAGPGPRIERGAAAARDMRNRRTPSAGNRPAIRGVGSARRSVVEAHTAPDARRRRWVPRQRRRQMRRSRPREG